jgi:hemolysin activation/secretion protein
MEVLQPKTDPQKERDIIDKKALEKGQEPGIAQIKAEISKDNRTIVPDLKGIVVIGDAGQILQDGYPTFEGVQLLGIEVDKPYNLKQALSRFLNLPASFRTFDEISAEIAKFYRVKEDGIADVFVPEQDITTGVIQFFVLETRLRDVRIIGNKYIKATDIKKNVRIVPGEVIHPDKLEDDLNWIKTAYPYADVVPALDRAEFDGTSDLIFRVQDRRPYRVFTGFEDTGNDNTGDERWFVGFNWNNVFGTNQMLNYQFTTSSDVESLMGHSATYLIPLPWRHLFSISGSYATTRSDVAAFSSDGTSWQVSPSYTILLPRIGNYDHKATVGLDFKQSNNNLEFGGTSVFATMTDVNQVSGTYEGTLPDPWGATSANFSIFVSPGGMSDQNKDRNFDAARSRAKAEYVYARAGATRITRLPAEFSWIARGLYQRADGNLLSSEQFGLGGASTIRGYDEREANGDEGYYMSHEFRTPPISFGQLFGYAQLQDQLQFLTFFDYGGTENKFLLPGEDAHIQLMSVGGGLRYSVSQYMSVRFDYGWQMIDTGLNVRGDNSRGHLAINFSY